MVPEGTCERKPIVCTHTLPTIARVCLIGHDGCNPSSLGDGASAAVLCRPPQGSPPQRTGHTCTVPRQTSYGPHGHERADLAGFWWLITPDGETCAVVLNSILGMTVATPCSPRLKARLKVDHGRYESWQEPETPSCSYEVTRDRLSIICPRDDTPWTKKNLFRLLFSVRDLDNPVGVGSTRGWRLLRISTLF